MTGSRTWVFLAAALLPLSCLPLRADLTTEGTVEGGLIVEGEGDLPVHDVYGVVSQFDAVLLPSAPPGSGSDSGDLRPTHLTIRLERQDPAAAPREAAVNCLTRKKESFIRVTVSVGPPSPVEDWVRGIVTGILYRRAAMLGARFPEGEEVPALPYWIVEGAYQTVLGKNEETFKAVSRRASALGTMPLMETVIGWDGPGEGPVTQGWRGAFCWALYLFYQTAPGHLGELDRWFASLPRGDSPIRADKAAEKEWNEFGKALAAKREDIVYPWDLYPWDRSRAELQALKTIDFPAWTAPKAAAAATGTGTAKPSAPVPAPSAAAGEAVSSKGSRPGEEPSSPAPGVSASSPASSVRPWEAATVPLADLPKEAGHPLFAATLQGRIDKMIVLEMRANFAWRPVIGLYRDALAALLSPDPRVSSMYPARLAYAATAEERLGSLAGRMTDYVNWFEVNRRSGGEASEGEFGGYFDLQGRFDAMALRAQESAAAAP